MEAAEVYIPPMGFKSRASSSLFSPATLKFLGELQGNNDRDWFNANKERYESDVREPALEFIRQMGPHIKSISAHYEAIDKKVGGSLMRVYRDTRFSADKTPYKTNIGIQFRHKAGKDVHAPGFYMHVGLDGCFLAVGSWKPESESLAAMRKRIVDKPDEWEKARDDKGFTRHFEIRGESLKRIPRGFSEDDPHLEDLKRKDHIAVAELDIDDVIGPKFVDLCADRFAAARPYIQFLTKAVKAPF